MYLGRKNVIDFDPYFNLFLIRMDRPELRIRSGEMQNVDFISVHHEPSSTEHRRKGYQSEIQVQQPCPLSSFLRGISFSRMKSTSRSNFYVSTSTGSVLRKNLSTFVLWALNAVIHSRPLRFRTCFIKSALDDLCLQKLVLVLKVPCVYVTSGVLV